VSKATKRHCVGIVLREVTVSGRVKHVGM